MGEREIREKTAEIEAKILADIDRKWIPLANRCLADAEREYQAALQFVRDGGEVRIEPQATPPRITFPWLVE